MDFFLFNDTNKDKYNSFVVSQKYSQFLESWEWGSLAADEGSEVLRAGVKDGDEIVLASTAIAHSLPMGKSYWFCPRGPMIKDGLNIRSGRVDEAMGVFLAGISKIKNGSLFTRVEPLNNVVSLNGRERTEDVHPSKTQIVYLGDDEDQILKGMHQKTRYNIRVADKKGVKITEAKEEDFDDFAKLMETTAERNKFRIHDKRHYKNIFNLDFVRLLLAKSDDKLLAAGLFSFFGDTVTYIHGSSSNELRNYMAPFLLHWNIIKRAKNEGYKYYDFFGVDEKKWPGVTRFKRGFGGYEKEISKTIDYPANVFAYKVYKILRKLRRAF